MPGDIVLNSIKRANGAELTLPMTVGQGGALVVDAQGQMSVQADDAAPRTEIVQVYDFEAAPAALLDVLWDDLETGLALADVAFVKLRGSGISGTAAMRLQFKALSAAGVTVDTGYMAANTKVMAGNGQLYDTQPHNSNAGTMFYPVYATASATGYTYGPGLISFDARLRPHPDTDNRGVLMHVNGGYQQSTSFSFANVEDTMWKSYGTNAGIAGFPAGFRVYPSAGQINRGFLEVTAVLNPGA
jgi:hypothetical protein